MGDFCPICNTKEFRVLGKPKLNSISAGFIAKEYNVVQCKKCTVYYVAPAIDFTDEQWSKLYNSEYFASQSNWLLKRRVKELQQRFERAESYIERKNDLSMLDIGTGEGKTLIEGHSRGWKVMGIDIVDNRIDKAKSKDIQFVKAKFLDYDFPDNSFDFIYLDSVLEHVLSPKEYLIKISKILKPKGILYIGVPNENSLFNDIRRLAFNMMGRKSLSEKIKPFDSPYHVIGFNSDSLNFIINNLDFKVKYFRNFGRKFEFLSAPITNKSFWINLFFLFPIELIGHLIKRDVYYEVYLTKD